MNSQHEVRIHIDQTPYNSPNPTTGEALYILGKVSPGLDLYRKVGGDREDPAISNDRAPIHLKAGEHFHSGAAHKKEFTIVVNGKKKVVTKAELSFDDLVALAFNPVPTGPMSIHNHVRRRPTREPRRYVNEGSKRQNQEWNDLQCQTH